MRSARRYDPSPRGGGGARLEHGSPGCGFFLLVFYLLGGQFDLTKSNVTVFAAMFLLIGLTYGLLFTRAGA